jgi:hypothetical protein
MAQVFQQTLGPPPEPEFNDPFAPYVAALQRKLLQQPAPMYTPEQVTQRRADNQQQYNLGLLGQLSGDEGLTNVGAQVFKQALAGRQPKITERGVADPLTGEFKYDPDYLRQRDEQQLSGLEQKSAAARAAFDAQRAQAAERRWQQQQHDDTIAAMREATSSSANASRQGAQDARVWHAEDSLRNDYDRITKDTRDEMAMTQKLQQTIAGYAGRPMDGQAQQAVVILLNKFLDPGSVVREGEFDRVVKAQGLEATAGNYLNKIMKGEFLTPQATAQIQYLAGVYQHAAEAKMRQVGTNYNRIAVSRGLDPSNVISDPRWREPDPQAAQAGGGGGAGAGAVVDVGAALGRPGAPKPRQALPKANPQPAATNSQYEGSW